MTMKEKIQRSIEQKISEWQEDDIYAVSLYVFDEEDDPCRPVAVLGYNTERQVQKSLPEASGEQEARWNYAFWIQNVEMCLGQGDTAEDIKEWITEQGLWDNEDEITPKFVELLVAIVQDIHASGLLKDKFGREIPILIHELEYYEETARQNIEANGEALDRDFVSFCMPCMQEVQDGLRTSQNEMPRAGERITSPKSQSFQGGTAIGKKSTDMRMVIAFIVIIVLVMFSFWVLGLISSSRNTTVSEDTPQLADNFGEENEELPTSAPVEAEEQTSMSSEPKEAEADQSHWQVYIQPDMPEPYIEVLKLYEQAMNAGVKDFNDEEVMDRFNQTDGEWRYLYDIYCRRLAWDVEHNEVDDNYRYSLKDLTGDGFPELILGYKTTPEVIYYYSETEGIKMEYLSDYYIMTLYEGGIIEYISGGVTYTKTYLQFQAETESWELAARVVVDWDSQTDSDRGYYWGDDVGGDLTDNEPMSEEEYQKIMAQYATEPMELEWTSLVLSAE